MEFKGIDVSYFQGNIDWERVANNNIDFAMIRATYGTAGTDEMFEKNMEEIKKTNIHPGAYHYCYAMNTQEAVSEAEHFINIIKPYELHYPAAIDLEESAIAELGKSTVTDIILAFTNTLKSNGYYPILYVDLDWLKNYIDTHRIEDLDIWLSEWGPKMNYNKNVTMWQYSSSGNVSGIDDMVDMNISFKDYPTIIKQSGLNGAVNTPGSEDEPSFPNIRPLLYKVKKGDSLWSIAETFLGNGNRYREIMALNSLNNEVITPGQILRIPQNKGSGTVIYRVRRGETLWELAKRFLGSGSKYPEIMSLNGLTSETIYPGQLLKIPVTPEKVTITYTVKNGDTLWEISKRFLGNGNRYQEIMNLNGLTTDIIHPGEKLIIPPR